MTFKWRSRFPWRYYRIHLLVRGIVLLVLLKTSTGKKPDQGLGFWSRANKPKNACGVTIQSATTSTIVSLAQL